MIVDWKSASVHYQDEGHGPALVLLHGLGGNAENWLLQRRAFSTTHRVISIDLPGHGRSTGRSVSFADYPDAIAAVLDHARVHSATLCGLSKGARAGIAFASRHPERARALVIVNAFLHLRPDDRARRVALYDLLLEADGAKLWAKQLLELMGVSDHPVIVRGFMRSLDSIDPHHIRRLFLQQIDWDQRPELANIPCPSLLVRGSRDGFIPDYCVDDLRERLLESELAVLDTGHLPYLEQPADFNRVLSAFLAKRDL